MQFTSFPTSKVFRSKIPGSTADQWAVLYYGSIIPLHHCTHEPLTCLILYHTHYCWAEDARWSWGICLWAASGWGKMMQAFDWGKNDAYVSVQAAYQSTKQFCTKFWFQQGITRKRAQNPGEFSSDSMKTGGFKIPGAAEALKAESWLHSKQLTTVSPERDD